VWNFGGDVKMQLRMRFVLNRTNMGLREVRVRFFEGDFEAKSFISTHINHRTL
jgi:hypothetical protein